MTAVMKGLDSSGRHCPSAPAGSPFNKSPMIKPRSALRSFTLLSPTPNILFEQAQAF